MSETSFIDSISCAGSTSVGISSKWTGSNPGGRLDRGGGNGEWAGIRIPRDLRVSLNALSSIVFRASANSLARVSAWDWAIWCSISFFSFSGSPSFVSWSRRSIANNLSTQSSASSNRFNEANAFVLRKKHLRTSLVAGIGRGGLRTVAQSVRQDLRQDDTQRGLSISSFEVLEGCL